MSTNETEVFIDVYELKNPKKTNVSQNLTPRARLGEVINDVYELRTRISQTPYICLELGNQEMFARKTDFPPLEVTAGGNGMKRRPCTSKHSWMFSSNAGRPTRPASMMLLKILGSRACTWFAAWMCARRRPLRFNSVSRAAWFPDAEASPCVLTCSSHFHPPNRALWHAQNPT